jgi:hypothetical protein
MKPWTDEMSVQGFLRLGEERRIEKFFAKQSVASAERKD